MALPPITGSPPQAAPASQARAAAQRAFFDAAMGRAQATAQVSTQPPAQVQARPSSAVVPPPKVEASFDPNTQPLDPTARPGSIVNIRV